MKIEIETASVTDRGLNPQYLVNEDSYLILEKERVFAVADGVGGAHAGDVASQSALKTINNMVSNDAQNTKRLKDDTIGFVKDLINAANAEIYQLGNKIKREMASTIAIMVIGDEYAILGHVGDSRIYVSRDGNLLQLTRDHSKLQSLIDLNLLTPAEEAGYQEGHIITKALGVAPNVEPDIQKVMLKPGDIFILCTDGIHAHNSNAEILANIQKNKHNLKKVCEVFKNQCYERGAKDNLTAVVLSIKKSDDDVDTKQIKMTQDMMDTIMKK
ncbi:MAG: PP2C family protein-serine/threonine phosphatase [bacterium]